MLDMDTLTTRILAARLDNSMPAPTEQWIGSADIDDAYRVQHDVLGEIARRQGARIIGRKVGCTNQSARELLGLDGPFHGALLSNTAMASPARISRGDYPFIVLEPEFALRLGKPLGPAATPHTAESVAEQRREGVLGRTILPLSWFLPGGARDLVLALRWKWPMAIHLAESRAGVILQRLLLLSRASSSAARGSSTSRTTSRPCARS